MQDDFFRHLTSSLSVERLHSYRKHDGADDHTTFARYLWNLAVCESLYSPIQLCEISLRNTLHCYLSKQFNERWFDSGRLDLTQWGIREVERAKEKLQKLKRSPEPSRVVAELTFGFWTHLFQSNYVNPSAFLPKGIKHIFPHLEKSKHNQKQIKRDLDSIRDLRNRVFHHERIVHWNDLQEKHHLMLEIIRWSSPELHELAGTLDRFTEIYTAGIDPWKTKIQQHWPKT